MLGILCVFFFLYFRPRAYASFAIYTFTLIARKAMKFARALTNDSNGGGLICGAAAAAAAGSQRGEVNKKGYKRSPITVCTVRAQGYKKLKFYYVCKRGLLG